MTWHSPPCVPQLYQYNSLQGFVVARTLKQNKKNKTNKPLKATETLITVLLQLETMAPQLSG